MTLAKPLAGGLPIDAVLRTNLSSYKSWGPWEHVCSWAPCMQCCLSNFLNGVLQKEQYFKELSIRSLDGSKHVKEVRGQGLIVGIELDVLQLLWCRETGILILTAGKGNVVRLVPPLVISEQELEKGAQML